jgi:hypothetical protein
MDEARATAADVERERRRLERVRRRERAARRRALRVRLLPLAAAAVAVAAAAGGLVLVTGATHARRAPAHRSSARPTTRPRTVRPAPAPAPRPRAQPAGLPARPSVTLIGDSVADEIAYLASARALVARGVRLRLEVAPCRRLSAESCTVAGYRPPTALELVREQGHDLGQVAIVAVGYNDYETTFTHDATQVLDALHRAGVREVIWLTLRATHHPYLTMNAALAKLAGTTPWLTVVDWNRYSRSHPDWFKDDGLHLTHAGAIAMARLLHRTLASLPRTGVTTS